MTTAEQVRALVELRDAIGQEINLLGEQTKKALARRDDVVRQLQDIRRALAEVDEVFTSFADVTGDGSGVPLPEFMTLRQAAQQPAATGYQPLTIEISNTQLPATNLPLTFGVSETPLPDGRNYLVQRNGRPTVSARGQVIMDYLAREAGPVKMGDIWKGSSLQSVSSWTMYQELKALAKAGLIGTVGKGFWALVEHIPQVSDDERSAAQPAKLSRAQRRARIVEVLQMAGGSRWPSAIRAMARELEAVSMQTLHSDLNALQTDGMVKNTASGWMFIGATKRQVPAGKEELEVVWSGQKTDPPLTNANGLGSSLNTEGAVVNRAVRV